MVESNTCKPTMLGQSRERGSVDMQMIFIAGLAAGVIWITLIAHVVFGVVLAETCRLLALKSSESGARAQTCIEGRRG